jgi:tetratricopeptide (TPR) repeat protein/predicted aspartyl protease
VREAGDCQLQMFSAKTVPSNNGSVLISVMLGVKPGVFMVDTGAFWSTIRERDTAGLQYHYSPAPVYGAGGKQLKQFVTIPSVKIGPGEFEDREFIVAPDAMASDDRIDGVLGGDFLRHLDLELDLANDVVNFFIPSNCGEKAVYWPNSGYAAIPLLPYDQYHLHVSTKLNGRTISTLIDTGASNTILSLTAADDLFDLSKDSPGVESAGDSRTMDGQRLPLYRHQFDLLEVGGIKFHNPWLVLAEDRMPQSVSSDQLILGTHQLRQLHLYISYKDNVIYATTSTPAGAPAAAASGSTQPTSPKLDALDRDLIAPLLSSIAAHLKAGETDRALADADEIVRRYPAASQSFFVRGQVKLKIGRPDAALADLDLALQADPRFGDAYTLRGQILHALHRDGEAKVDLDKAIELQPASANEYVARAMARQRLRDEDGALADEDKVIELQPSQVTGYLDRAAIYRRRQDYVRAQADLDQALVLDPHNARVYDERAGLDARQGQYGRAVDEAGHAIELQPKVSGYLNNRCWYRAMLGQLDAALDDCNQAITLDPHNASAYDSRGFIELKQQRIAAAIADYDMALSIWPDAALTLYGRGMAKQAKGDAKGAKADIQAAERLQPDVAAQYGK